MLFGIESLLRIHQAAPRDRIPRLPIGTCLGQLKQHENAELSVPLSRACIGATLRYSLSHFLSLSLEIFFFLVCAASLTISASWRVPLTSTNASDSISESARLFSAAATDGLFLYVHSPLYGLVKIGTGRCGTVRVSFCSSVALFFCFLPYSIALLC